MKGGAGDTYTLTPAWIFFIHLEKGGCYNDMAPLFLILVKPLCVTVLFQGACVDSAPLVKGCSLQSSFEPAFVAAGDYIIGGIFPLHYNQEMPDLNSTYKPPAVKCNGQVKSSKIRLK